MYNMDITPATRNLLFATNNQRKVDEIKIIVGSLANVLSLKEAGIDIDIPEPFDTLEENASVKSATIYQQFGFDCFSEDTGLEVDALQGAPGVKSARYAQGDDRFTNNTDKLLYHLTNFTNRSARFRTIISLLINGQETRFEGVCHGHITTQKTGTSGFGYDPVFVPAGANKTFAQMTPAEKNTFSHRQKATLLMLAFLSKSGK